MNKMYNYVKENCSEESTVLSNDEMIELFTQYHKDDINAKEKLIIGNIRLVSYVLNILHLPIEENEDFFQVGCIGLIKAINKFDLSYNNKFSTFAVPMIIGEIRSYYNKNQTISGLSKKMTLINKINTITLVLENKLGREPTLTEISEALGVSKKIIEEALIITQKPVSFFINVNPHPSHEETYLIDVLADEKFNIDKLNSCIDTNTAIKRLSEEERKFIYHRYVLDKTQMEMTKEINCSQMTVSRIDRRILSDLKKYVKY